MNGLRNLKTRLTLGTKALLAVVLLGGVFTIATATPAAAFSATPVWYTTGGTQVSSLTCGTWYYTTLSSATGGGSASITLYGGGAGGGPSSPYASGNTENLAVGGAGAGVAATFSVSAGQSVATFIGCGGGGGAARQGGSGSEAGAGGTGYSSGGTGGGNTTASDVSGGGGGGGSTAVCVYGTAGSPCATLLAIAGGGGGAGGAACDGNGGSGGEGNAGATTGATPSETNASAPGGSATGQGFGGGGGASDGDKQAGGGGGGGGVGAAGGSTNTPTTGGTGAAANTAGSGGATLSGGSGPTGSAGSGPDASGNGGAGATNTKSGSVLGIPYEAASAGGGGGGYYGGGGGDGDDCALTPELGAGGGGAGSSWVSTGHLTSFTNGSNPSFVAGSGITTACGKQQTQGTAGGSTGTGGSDNTSTSGVNAAYAGCPGGISLTWSALPGAPSGVSGTTGAGSITASWTAPADPGTASITGYTLVATPTPSGTPVSQTFNSTATTETLTGLTTGTSYNLTVAAVTSVGTGPAASASNNPILIGSAPTITSANSTTFATGVAGSFTVTTTGTPTPSITKTGALPSGVTFVNNGNGTATLAGTPASGSFGIYNLSITASNGVGTAAVQSFTLTVDGPPTITSGSSTAFTEGSPGTFTVTSTGLPAATLSESGALPSGVTFVNNGGGTATLAGTPAAGSHGVYTFTITANNGIGTPATQTFTLTVQVAPGITSADATTFTEGVGGSFSMTTTGLPTAALSEVGALPTGVTFVDNGNGTGTLAGTPAAGTQGIYDLTLHAHNVVSPDATQAFTLTVQGPPSITSGNSATFAEAYAGTFTVTSTGLPTAALSETGSLPTGVTFTDNGNGTAILAGTPAPGTHGVYTFTITANNGIGTPATQTFTLTVQVAPGITSADATTFTEGVAGTFTVTSTGLPPAALSESGTLPAGVTFVDNGDGTATLAGTPAAGTHGYYPFTINAANGVSPEATQNFTLTVDVAPGITSADATTFSQGISGSFTVTTTGLPTASLTESGALPTGVSFSDNPDGTATLAGTPAAGTFGVYDITIDASNNVSPDAVQAFTLTVDGAPTITSADHATFAEANAGTFTVTTTGLPTAGLTESGGLPTGVSFTDNGDGTATLAGTPAAGTNGYYTFTIGASNGVSPDATQTFTLTVDVAPGITSGDNTTFIEGHAGTFTVTTTGRPPASVTESGALPAGVSLTDNGGGTATLAGTPAPGTNGIYNVTVEASNGVSPVSLQAFTLTVDVSPTIPSANSATFIEGSAGTFTVVSTGRPTAALTESGHLPNGVSFADNNDGTATLAGTPAAGTHGVYHFTITANNGVAPNATQAFTLTVDVAPGITSGDQATFTERKAGSFLFTSTGLPTASLRESGALPSGVSFTDDGDGTAILAGTAAPGTHGVFNITIQAFNGVNPDATQAFTLTVNQIPIFLSPGSASFTKGSLGRFTVDAVGDPTPTLTEQGSLPAGVAYAGGVISGTPTVAGSFPVELSAVNGAGTTVQTFTLTVLSLRITTSSLPNLSETVHYRTQLAATGGRLPLVWSADAPLPLGLAISSAGVLSGTVSVHVPPATYTIDVKVTDTATKTDQTATRALKLIIKR